MHDVHTIGIRRGGTALKDLQRLTLGLLISVAIPGPVGAVTGGVVLTPGAGYTSIPTATPADGTGGTFTPSMAVETTTLTTAGGVTSHSYIPGESVTMTGGTASQQAIAQVLTTRLAAAPVVNAPGTGYAIGNVITGTGATASVKPTLTVTHTQVVSATVVNGGSGGTPGAVTITGTTGTGTPFQCTGTIGAGGILAGALVVSVAGDYTVDATNIAAEPVTGGSLTGCTVSVVLGVKTVVATTKGVFTANPSALTQYGTTGSGTGVTFNTLLFGVDTYQLTNTGMYSVLPVSALTQGSSTGDGTGFTMTVNTWKVGSLAASGGSGYKSGSAVVFAGGGATAQATGAVGTNATGASVSVPVTGLSLGDSSYGVEVTPNMPAVVGVYGKSDTGFNVLLRPIDTGEPVYATAFDVMVWR